VRVNLNLRGRRLRTGKPELDSTDEQDISLYQNVKVALGFVS